MGSFGNYKGAGIDEFEGLQLSGTDSDCTMQPTLQNKVLGRRQIMKLAVMGVALCSLLATVFYCSGFGTPSTVAQKHDDNILTEELDKELDAFVGLSESSGTETLGCEDLVMVKDAAVVSNNLGGKGPDTDEEEGIIYTMYAYMKDDNGTEIAGLKVKVEIHATTEYDHHELHSKNFNGLEKKFLAILIKSGTDLGFNISVFDFESGLPLKLPYFSVTFFDLDQADDDTEKEYVIAKDFSHYYVSAKSEILATKNDTDGTTTFISSKPGTGKDNPKESEALEPEAKNKGVTLQYLGRESVDFHIGAKGGKQLRGFVFTLRPSLLCAKTHIGEDWVDPFNTSVEGVELPLMDGVTPVTGMEVPVIKIDEETGQVTVGNETIDIGLGDGKDHSDEKGEAVAKSGTKAMLIAVTLLAVVWPLSNLQ